MLIKCDTCGVPAKECVPSPSFFSKVEWTCRDCLEDSKIRCSYCDTGLCELTPLPEPLDDQSFLCPSCDTQLLEELNDFTDNFESYTAGPTGTPWYQHRLSASPGK